MNNGDEETKKAVIAQNMAEHQQMELALKDEKFIIDYGLPECNYTGERFVRDYPERTRIAIKLFALGFSNYAIGKQVHANPRTIQQVRYRSIEQIDQQKKEARAIVFPLMMMSADRAMEALPNASAKDAAIIHGISRDSFMHLSGQPTQRVEINHHIDLVAEVALLVKEAQEKVREIQARIIEEPAQLEDANV